MGDMYSNSFLAICLILKVRVFQYICMFYRERPVSLSGAEQKCGLNGEMIEPLMCHLSRNNLSA